MATRLATGATKLRLRNGSLAITANPVSPGPLVGMTNIANERVFQRVGTSRTLNVNMTYTGGAPVGVEAQIVDYTNGNTVVVDWTALNNFSAASGSATGQITVPQGCWYRLKIRSVTDRATVLSGTTKFGVGIVIGYGGQSNMRFFWTDYSTLPNTDPRSIEYVSSASGYLRLGQYNDAYAYSLLYGSGYSSYSRDNGNLKGDPIILFTNAIAAAMNLPVMAVALPINGSSIDSWVPATATNWVNFAAKAAETGSDMEMFLWYQGETDAVSKSTTYMTNAWDALRQQFYDLTGRNSTNSHFGIVSLAQGQYQNSTPGQFGIMRANQVAYGMSGRQGVFYLGGAHDSDLRDAVHVSNAGLNRFGKRWAITALSRFGAGIAAFGPYVTGATYSAGAATLTFAHSGGGTALVDGAGGNGAGLLGFEFKDAGGNVLTINSTQITSGTTVRFTLSGTPATVSYAMMDYPFNVSGSYVSSSVLYDNVSPGFPLRPFTAIPIT